MPGPNTSGTPDPGDYIFGRGEVFAALLDDDDEPSTGYVHLGNCPELSQNVATEKVEHFSSMSGIKTIDATAIIQTTAKLNFTLEEFNEYNLAKFLKASVATITNPAVAGIAERVGAYTDVELGRWYDFKTDAGVRAYDIDATKVTLEKDGAPDVALVEGTDFELDLIWGRFKLLSTAVNIAAGDDVNFTLAADGTAVASYRRIEGLQDVGQKYEIVFIFKNAANAAKQLKISFHKVSLEPNGDLSLIQSGTEYGQMQFECSCEESSATEYADSPVVSVDYHTAA